MAVPARKRMTYSDYLRLEAETGVKHEFVDGQAYAMSGGTLRHGGLATNLAAMLFTALEGKPCRPYSSDVKVRTLVGDVATYPDVAVVCGPIQPHPEDPNAYTNPALVVEVLSPSTEGWDRGGKFDVYASIEGLKHYVLVPTTHDQVEVFTRQEDGSWSLRKYLPGDTVELSALGIQLDVDTLFADLPALPEGVKVKRMAAPSE